MLSSVLKLLPYFRSTNFASMNKPVQYLIPVYYQLLVLPYEWSIVTVNFNTYIFERAETNKHAEYVKPSDTAPFDGLTFDILTRETVFY